MTDQANNSTVATGTAPRLLTRQQVLDALKQEVAATSLTETARKYQLAPQQLSDCMRGRASLSKRVLKHIRYELIEFFRKQAG